MDGDERLEVPVDDDSLPFDLATTTIEDGEVVLAEDESAALQSFHERVLEEIGEESLAGLSRTRDTDAERR